MTKELTEIKLDDRHYDKIIRDLFLLQFKDKITPDAFGTFQYKEIRFGISLGTHYADNSKYLHANVYAPLATGVPRKRKEFDVKNHQEVLSFFSAIMAWIEKDHDKYLAKITAVKKQREDVSQLERQIFLKLQESPIECNWDGQNILVKIGKGNIGAAEAVVEALKKWKAEQ